MDNKQATRLREYAADQTIHPQEREDLIAGADALEFKEWLFEPDPILGDLPIVRVLWSEHAGSVADFLAFCEAKFEESKRHG